MSARKRRAKQDLIILAGGGLAATALWLLRRSETPADTTSPLFIDDETEALARVIHSEAASHTVAERLAVAWVARNKARKRGITVAELVCQPCGRQGGKMANGKRRTFSSARPKGRRAPAKARAQAAAVLAAPTWMDPTRGATTIFEPAEQNRLHKQGRVRFTAAQIRQRWGGVKGRVGRWEYFS